MYRKTIIVSPEEKDFTIKTFIESRISVPVKIVSNNAYVACVLQNGTIIGYGEGETIINIYEGAQCIKSFNVIVLDGKSEIPVLVNRYNGVGDNILPTDLVAVDRCYLNEDEKREIFICKEVLLAFIEMHRAAEKDGIHIAILEGYRSIEDQKNIVQKLVDTRGEEVANKQAAPAGFSEHHTGFAIDIGGKGHEDKRFKNNNEDVYKWIEANCYKYGFMIKNLKGKEHITGTIYEPWHIRYLGNLEIAKLLHNKYLTLDEYWQNLDSFYNVEALEKSLTSNEYEYVRLVAAEARISYKRALRMMLSEKEKNGISFRDFFKMKLYRFSEKTRIQRGEYLNKISDTENMYFNHAVKKTGMKREDIERNLMIFNDNPYAQVGINEYIGLDLYKADPQQIEEVLLNIRERRLLGKKLVSLFDEMDHGECKYENLSAIWEKYYEVTKKTIIKSDIEDMRETIEKCKPEILEDEEILRSTVADMLACKRTMGFLEFEYFMYGLQKKELEERRKYISNLYRTKKLNMVNDRIQCELLDNKEKTYKLFKEFYGREVIAIHSKNDFDKFEKFCKKHDRFVKKPLNNAMGEGVALVQIDKNTDIKDLFFSLVEELGKFIIEELIICHDQIKRLNPDSVNTVRMTTYYDGQSTHILWPWMRIGRAGRFVDNAGAGGLGVAIEKNTGVFFSDGFDENGHSFKMHPENGIVFNGYKCPNWEGALKLGYDLSRKLVDKVDGIRFVGWDITYTQECKWIVIEGNAFPQAVQQACYGRGLKKEIDAVII